MDLYIWDREHFYTEKPWFFAYLYNKESKVDGFVALGYETIRSPRSVQRWRFLTMKYLRTFTTEYQAQPICGKPKIST